MRQSMVCRVRSTSLASQRTGSEERSGGNPDDAWRQGQREEGARSQRLMQYELPVRGFNVSGSFLQQIGRLVQRHVLV